MPEGKGGVQASPRPVALGLMGPCDGEVVDGGETLKAGLLCSTEKGGLVFLLKERGWGSLFPISSSPRPGLLFPSSLQGPESLLMEECDRL